MNELIERLKAGIADIKDQHAEEGLSGAEQSLVDAAKDAITALSAQPSPDAAQGSPKVTTMADLLAIRGGSQMQDRQNYSRMEYPILESQPAAQGSEHGGEVPMEFVREMLGAWPKIGLAHPLTATHCIRYIAQRAIDRQNRASQPVQGVAESVADESEITRLLTAVPAITGALRDSGFPINAERVERMAESLRTLYEQSRQSPRAGMVSVSRDALTIVLDYYFGRTKSAGGHIIMDCYEKLQSALSHSSKGDEHGK